MENKEWFLYVVDHHEGPFTAAEIKKLIKKGEAKTSSYVWKDGLEDWMLMTDVTEFGSGGAKSDGHGPFSFITGLLKRKPKPGAITPVPGAAAAALAESAGAPSGPDISDVSPSDSVWCLNSNKEFTGPFSLKNIVRKINESEVSVEDGVWKEGWSSFTRISNIPGFMEGVKPDVLSGTADKKKKSKKASAGAKASAAAMGFGGSSVRRRHWYHSNVFRFFVLVALPAAIYQALVFGYLEPVLEKIPGSKEKVAALNLKPIPTEKASEYAYLARDLVMPYYYKVAAMLPEPLQALIAVVQIPETVSPADTETLREVAGSDVKQGVRVAAAMPPGDEQSPAFLIASNGPDGTVFTITLRGKEGTLLNAVAYEKSFQVDISKHLGSPPRFTLEGSKPLPKGQYTLIIHESDKQNNPEAIKALAEGPKKTAPSIIPPGKVAFVVDSFFLGGKKDAVYEARLKEYQERIKVRMGTEAVELKQLALLLEQIANESYTKFGALIVAPPSPQRKNAWMKYHLEYGKLSGQIKATLAKATPEARKDFAMPHLYKKLDEAVVLTESLHQAETDAIEKGGTAAAVTPMGASVATAIADLKTSIFKVIK